MRHIRLGDTSEVVIERADFPRARIQDTLRDETVAVLGYGTQGRAQALNMRDQGVRVLVGLRPGKSWDLAQSDGWRAGQTLFTLDEAAARGTIIAYLLSDAGQKEYWAALLPRLTPGKALYFSHGFSIVFSDLTGVVPPKDIDVILVAPKGSGTTLRRQFLEGTPLNSSIAVHQDASQRARERCIACAFAIGSGHLFETTLRREVFADLTGERGVLMGAIFGLWLAQYEVLRAHGHSPVEAFNETVEEATQSLYPLIAENGMEWMYRNCSQTAQRGALDWFERFRDAARPVFEELYRSVASGDEARRALASHSNSQLEKELRAIAESEMWQAGAAVRSLRPDRAKTSS